MANNVYVGSRYVPIFDGAWSNSKTYEPLTIVEYSNSSYTSKKSVPAGTLPTNTTYWALTGNYNGQISNLQTQIDYLNLEFVRPEQYGAKGNGTTNDTSAFSSAIATGKPLLLTGTYLIKSDLTFTKGAYSFNNAELKCENAVITLSSNTTLYGIKVRGGRTSTSTAPVIYIPSGSTNILIDHCYLHDTYGMGIGIETSTKITIKNCLFTTIGTVNKQCAIWLHGNSPDSNSDIIIESNIMSGIYLDGIGIYNIGHVTIKDNKISDCGNHPPYSGAIGACGIFVGDSAHSCIITGNDVRNCSEGGITLSSYSYGIVSDNIVISCGLSGITFMGSNIVCSGNRILNCGTYTSGGNTDRYGINARSLERSVIANNFAATLTGSGQLLGLCVGSDSNGTSNHNVIIGNNFCYNVNGGYDFPHGDTGSLYTSLNLTT